MNEDAPAVAIEDHAKHYCPASTSHLVDCEHDGICSVRLTLSEIGRVGNLAQPQNFQAINGGASGHDPQA